MNNRTILLVEDDLDDQDFFREALLDVANVVLYGVANNGQEALDKMKNQTLFPDLIFMDINMPVMDGLVCVTEISKNIETRHIPVVILSTSTEQTALFSTLGARATLRKPTNIQSLTELIKSVISINYSTTLHASN